jgi:hypothetical protein
MIRFILLNLVLAGLYLHCIETNRYICVAMWMFAPMLNIGLMAWINRE